MARPPQNQDRKACSEIGVHSYDNSVTRRSMECSKKILELNQPCIREEYLLGLVG